MRVRRRIGIRKRLGDGCFRTGQDTHSWMQVAPCLHERVLVPIVADPAMVFVETIRHDGETMRHGRYGAKQIMEGTWIVSFHEAIQRLGAFLVLS